MKRLLLILCSLLAIESSVAMGDPLYIINGAVADKEKMESTSPDIIKNINVLSGEDAVEKYGLRGSNGVIEVALLYDTPPVFAEGQTFGEYLKSNIKWVDNEELAQVRLKYRLKTDSTVELVEVMESTNNRLKKRVLEAFNSSPKWHSPTMNMGEVVELEMQVFVQLPESKVPPRIIIR